MCPIHCLVLGIRVPPEIKENYVASSNHVEAKITGFQ